MHRIAPEFENSDAAFRALFEALPISVALFSGGRLVYINPAGAAILEAASGELKGCDLMDLVHPMDRTRTAKRLTSLTHEANAPAEIRIVTARGNLRVMILSSRKVHFGSDEAVLVTGMDMTRHSEVEAQLRESEQNFRRLFESMQDVYYRTDASGVVQMVGPGVRRVLGYEPHEIVGRSAEAYYPSPADRDALKQAIREFGEVSDFPGQMVCRDGRVIDISISSHALYDESGNFAGVEGIYRDVTERKMLERELRRLATTDSLTGVANRRAFLEHAALIFRNCRRYPMTIALLILDLDHFKSINDRHGHVAGDDVLVRFVGAVGAELRETDVFGRLGGEEFCVLLQHSNPENANGVACRILERVRTMNITSPSGESFGITVSIGFTVNAAEDNAIERLLERADKALYAAKHAGRNCAKGSE